MKEKLKEALILSIEFSYEKLLQDYLSANILASELDFINYIYKNQKKKVKSIKNDIDFYFDDTIVTEDELKNKISKDEYWYYVEYQKYLSERKLKIEVLPPQQNEKSKTKKKETELSERIKKHFGFFNKNCPRQHKQILNDTDFEKLIEWTIWYFENDFKVPEISESIKVVNTNKTFVQLAFRYLFKELHKSSPYPETLFNFYRSIFNPYSEDKKSNFKAVKNNDEVKRLMKIDY